jgi:uncharacterized integral membrane protein (TIGR00698 family)
VSTDAERARHQLGRVLVVVVGLAVLFPAVSAPVALGAGIAIALTVENPFPHRTRAVVGRLLPAAVVGLGGAMDLAAVLRAGARGIGYTVASIAACLALGYFLARVLDVPSRPAVLVTVGTAICGGSAIAATAPVVGADDREISVALLTVFLLNSVALLAFPPLGRMAELGDAAFGMWAALAIHDTSSVVGAALQFGPEALSVGTTVKLARALWIVPVALAIGLFERHRRGSARARGRPPWFIAGFLGAAALATWIPALRPAGLAAAAVASRALVLTLFLIGLNLSRASLRAMGLRPLALGFTLWAAMAGATLAAIRMGVIVP